VNRKGGKVKLKGRCGAQCKNRKENGVSPASNRRIRIRARVEVRAREKTAGRKKVIKQNGTKQ